MALRITGEMHSVNEQQIDYNELYQQLREKYSSLFMTQYDGIVFIFKALGRGEFKEIMSDARFNDFIKEEMLCVQCVIYPENFDWVNCPAGIPSLLAKEILEKSFLDFEESMKLRKNYYRAEMYDIDNQITCIIQEAFPNFTLEEIESWNMEDTMKYLSRAEWKLQNLRGVSLCETQPRPETATATQPPKSDTTIRGGSKKSKLTPEKTKAKAEFLKKFPQFAGYDSGEDGIEGLEQGSVDTTPYALRVGW